MWSHILRRPCDALPNLEEFTGVPKKGTRTNCRLATSKNRRTQKSQWHHKNVNCHTYVILNVLSSVVWAGGKICTQNMMLTSPFFPPLPPPPPPPERNSSLRQVRQMFTSASPANVHFGKSGKCSLRQGLNVITSASLGNNPNTSCRHCMRTTAGAQEHPGYSADATTPWQTCSGLPVGLDETAPQTGRLPSEKIRARTPAASPPKTFCSVMSQTGRGPVGWTGSVTHHAAAEGQPR